MKRIPDFPELVNVEFDILPEVREALSAHPPEVSTVTTGNVFAYRHETSLKAARLNGNIVFTGFYRGIHFFSQPIGGNKVPETMHECLSRLKKDFGSGQINNVPKSQAETLRDDKRFLVHPDRSSFDYIYSVKELAELPGEKFHDKKNLVKQFMKKYQHEHRTLDKGLIAECLKLEEEWCRLRNCKEDETAAAESKAIYELLTHFSELELFGGVIIIDGKIQAFTILQRMNKNTAVTHVEKANTEYKGIYQAINNYTALNELKEFEYVNREEDLGHSGLRKAKLSYNPVKLEEKYIIELR